MGAVDRDRIAADLAALVQIPSLTGDEDAVQTELGLRMGAAGLEVERIDHPAADLAADPDFPGIEVARRTLPVVAGSLRGDEPGRQATSCSGRLPRSRPRSTTAGCTAAAVAT